MDHAVPTQRHRRSLGWLVVLSIRRGAVLALIL
jgi:hypothetical protein